MEFQMLPPDQAQPQAAPAVLESPIQYKTRDGQDASADEQAVKDLVSKHMARYGAWASWRRSIETVWQNVYELFVASGSPSRIETKSRIVVPVVFQILESALPKIINVLFGSPDWLGVTSRSTNKMVDQRILDAKRDLLLYQLDLNDYFSQFLIFLKQLLMYGTSYFYVYWKVKREWVYENTPTRAPLTEMGTVIKENNLTWERKLVYKAVERRPCLEVLDIDTVYPDPDAADLDNATGVYVRSRISLDEFKELCSGQYPVYANCDKVIETAKAAQDSQVVLQRKSARGTSTPAPAARGTSVDLLTFWGREDLDGDGIMEEVHLVIANGCVLVKATRNPFEHQKRPIVRGVLFPVPNEWYGMGLIEPVIPLVYELNTIRNQNIDMNNLIINRMWKVDLNADIDTEVLFSGPNNIIKVSPMEGVEVIPQEPIPQSPTEMSSLIQADIDNTAVPKSIQGSPSSGALGRTARGAQMIIGQALEKFGMGSKLLEEMVVRKCITMMDKLNAQFLDSDEVLTEFYGDLLADPMAVLPIRLTPEEIRTDVAFKITGVSETITSEATINQLVAFTNTFKGLPFDWASVAGTMWKLMRINAPPPIPPAPPVNAPLPSGEQPPQGQDAVAGQIDQNGTAAPIQVPQ
jgi:hypothetical protein